MEHARIVTGYGSNLILKEMKTIEIKLYKFSELSEEAKQKAVEKLSDINLYSDWFDCIYEDAAQIGLKIEGFDIYRGNFCAGHFIDSPTNCADLIIKNHGEMCETYKTAKEFLADRDRLVEKYSDGVKTDIVTEENEYDFDNECDDLEEEFLRLILEDYRIMLSQEYDYRSSEEAIIETIEANDYDFTEDGELY